MKTTPFLLLFIFLFAAATLAADSTVPAASAINSFGIDLLRKTAKPDANALLSPYSLEIGLVMAYAGANSFTRDEMAKVLHLGSDEKQTHNSFGLLQQQINGLVQRNAKDSANLRKEGMTNDPITLTVANRLFAQQGAFFKAPFTDLLKTNYGAPLESVDFSADPPNAAKVINNWVDQQTHHRIQNLLPDGALDTATRLVLANAVYMKAPWETPFEASATKPYPFHVAGRTTVNVPTMGIEESFGYMKFNGFTAVTLPYNGDELQFLILLPDAMNGLAELESKVTNLRKCTELPKREVRLHLPKFKMEQAMSLKESLQELGMKTAFDPFNANFDHISEYDTFFLSAVFHKTFLILDEEGTEAAAATVLEAEAQGIMPKPPKPVEVRIDHPFLFAIQHRASGACLFLGHVVDPR